MFSTRMLFAGFLLGCGAPVGGVSELASGEWVDDAGVAADAAPERLTNAIHEESVDAGADGGLSSDGAAPARSRARIEHDDPAVEAAIQAWRSRFEGAGDVPNPDRVTCDDRFRSLEVIAPSDLKFRRLCQRCNTLDDHPACSRLGRIYACAAVEYKKAYVVLDRSFAEVERKRAALTIHETIHHLGLCTEEDRDPGHDHGHWWCGDPDDCIEGAAFADR